MLAGAVLSFRFPCPVNFFLLSITSNHVSVLEFPFAPVSTIDSVVLFAGVGNFCAIFLFPILMYYFRFGVTGAAISTVISQYVCSLFILFPVFLMFH